MNTLILREATRILVSLILVFSVFMLLRGHDHPGGGFIGGLIASIAFCLYMFAADAQAVRALVRVEPGTIVAVGLSLALLAATAGFMVDGSSFFASEWTTIAGVKLGTPMLFDTGVYLVVVGAVLRFVVGIREQ